VVSDSTDGSGDFDRAVYQAEYCEWCGTLHEASDELAERVEEPVSRIDLLEAAEAFGEEKDMKATETTAEELRECDCGGQVVNRVYPIGSFPPVDYEPDADEITGRDPDEDALIFTSDGEQRFDANDGGLGAALREEVDSRDAE
jgi:hypothetical protein